MTIRLAVAALFFGGALAAQGSQRSGPGTSGSLGIDFVKIPAGEFRMGCSADDKSCEPDEKPAHAVRITKAFELAKYEVTQAQWSRVMDANPSANRGDRHPVDNVGKTDVEQFLSRLNARGDQYRYRLPTEAEWEYAARAGSTGAYAGRLDEIAWYADNSDDGSHPVGGKTPNAWGLYDMVGNVREWVADQYSANYYSNSPSVDPTGPSPGQRGRGAGPDGRRGRPGGARDDGPPPPEGRRGRGPGGARDLPVIRGGAWDNPAPFLRVSVRYSYYGPTLRVSDLGFRLVREPVTP